MFNLLTGPPISNTFFSFLSALWEWAERRKEVCCGQWAPKTAQAAIQKHEFMNVFDGGSRSCVIWMIDCFLFSLWWGLWALQRHGLRQKERTKRKTIMKFNGARRQEERVKWIPFNLSGSQHEMKWSVDGADWIGMNGTGPQAKRGKWMEQTTKATNQSINSKKKELMGLIWVALFAEWGWLFFFSLVGYEPEAPLPRLDFVSFFGQELHFTTLALFLFH